MGTTGSIGFFDSGVGGLTIWNEVVSLLPSESTVYIGDSLNAPYGTKQSNEIIDLSIKNTEKLLVLGAKIIVVACNTATTQAIEVLRDSFSVPFIGIEPAVKPAALLSRSGHIGVLATNGTIESTFFNSTIQEHSGDVMVHTQVGEGLVRAIEKGELHSKKTKEILAKHLKSLVQYDVDQIVLGCTHYPLLIPLIKDVLGSEISIVDSGKAVAQQTKRVLLENDLLNSIENTPTHQMYSNGSVEILKSIIEELSPVSKSSITYSSLYQLE